jgi:hypothetical protein
MNKNLYDLFLSYSFKNTILTTTVYFTLTELKHVLVMAPTARPVQQHVDEQNAESTSPRSHLAKRN